MKLLERFSKCAREMIAEWRAGELSTASGVKHACNLIGLALIYISGHEEVVYDETGKRGEMYATGYRMATLTNDHDVKANLEETLRTVQMPAVAKGAEPGEMEIKRPDCDQAFCEESVALLNEMGEVLPARGAVANWVVAYFLQVAIDKLLNGHELKDMFDRIRDEIDRLLS